VFFQSQDHQTAKQHSLTPRGCCLHGDPINGSLVTYAFS
jgi:hypothetical protein